MHCSHRTFVIVSLFSSLLSAIPAPTSAKTAESISLPVNGATVSIHRDAFGVAHIFARSDEAVMEAYGYTVATDRLWQLEMNRRAARGRLAEILGKRYVNPDRLVRITGYTDAELHDQFAALPDDIQAIITAYARGINRYVTEVLKGDKKALPYEFQTLDVDFAPWRVEDTMAFGAFMLRRFGEIGGRELSNLELRDKLVERLGKAAGMAVFADVRWQNDPGAPVTVPAHDVPRVKAAFRVPTAIHGPMSLSNPWFPIEEALPLWAELGVPSRLGSYAWVVRPERSTEHVAMLYGGPQMGFSAPEVVHEVQLQGESFDVIGMAFAGVPLVLIGHNPFVAWTSTTAVGDNVDTYIEQICDAGTGPSSGTRFHGTCVPMSKRQETIRVRGGRSEALEVWRTVHGPAVPNSDGQLAFAQKRAHWQREGETFKAFVAFSRARDLDSFAAGIPFVVTQHNFLYADRAGNIAYWQAGLVPLRPAHSDFRLPLSGDGNDEWPGGHRPTPTSINPAQGYLANWNNKPSVDFDSADSVYFGPQGRLSEILARLDAGPVSWDDMHDIAKDIARVDMQGREARGLKPFLLAATRAVPPHHPVAQAALELIEQDDGNAFADAVGSTSLEPAYLMLRAWKEKLMARLFGPVLGESAGSAGVDLLIRVLQQRINGHTSLPVGYDYFQGAEPYDVLSAAWDEALADLVAFLGDTPSQWDFPRPQFSFVHSVVGTIDTLPVSNRATYAQVLRLGPTQITGENIFTLGQSGTITYTAPQTYELDPHFADMLPLYRAFRYKPMELLPAAP